MDAEQFNILKSSLLFAGGWYLRSFLLPVDYGYLLSSLYLLLLVYLVYKYHMNLKLPRFPPNDLEVLIVGAGFSGLGMAIKVSFRKLIEPKAWVHFEPDLMCPQ